MPNIHPSSIVDPSAKLADDVEIGPNCVIDGPAVIGAGTRLVGMVYLNGPVVLGNENVLYPSVSIGFEPQATWFKGETAGVVIGDRNVFRECSTIHCSGTKEHPTTIGNNNMLMTCTHIGHDAVMGNNCVLASGALIGGHTVVEDNVNFGGNCGVHQFCRIGRLSFVGGAGAVTKDLPPFCVLSGNTQVTAMNVVGLRRSGVQRDAIDRLKQAFQVLYLDRHTRPVAVEHLAEMIKADGPGNDLITELHDFVASTERGICVHAKVASEQRLSR